MPVRPSIIACAPPPPVGGTVYSDDFSGVVGAPVALGGRVAVGSPTPFTWAVLGGLDNDVLVSDQAAVRQNSSTSGGGNSVFITPAFAPGMPDQYVQAVPVDGNTGSNFRIALASGNYQNGIQMRRQNVTSLRFTQNINQVSGTTILDRVITSGAIYRMEWTYEDPDFIVRFYENTGGGFTMIPDANNPWTVAGSFTGGDNLALVCRGSFDTGDLWTDFEGGLL